MKNIYEGNDQIPDISEIPYWSIHMEENFPSSMVEWTGSSVLCTAAGGK